MKRIFLILCLVMFTITGCTVQESKSSGKVQVSGAMRNVMWKGELQGTINLDTISDKPHLYGLGPVEFLKGELLVFDGKAYKSTVVRDTAMLVEESFQEKAPFFVHTYVFDWKEIALPDSVIDIKKLEAFLDVRYSHIESPFTFKLSGSVATAMVHIVNLPDGVPVSSPEEAHRGKTNYTMTNEDVDILGFFSRNHKGIFTHHDSFLHMHLITSDRTKMGHLDEVKFNARAVKLYLPVVID